MSSGNEFSRRQFIHRAGLAIGGCAALPAITAGCGPTHSRPTAGGLSRSISRAFDSSAAPRFVDATVEAGIDFIQFHGGCGLHYFVEQVAAGAAVFDANGDGFPDIYFPQPKPLGPCKSKFKEPLHHRLYLNDGKGRFTLARNAFGGVETAYGLAAAVGDYNNDGHPDLYVCCAGGNKLFRNRGDGTFEDVTERAGVAVGGFSTGAVWFDYDGDGLLDLYVLRYSKWTEATDRPCYTPTKRRDICKPQTYPAETNVLFHNNGDGTFTDVTKRSGASPGHRRSLSAAAVDFDGDGHLDLFVANDLGPNYLLRNNGNGTFTDVALEQAVAFGLTGAAQANMGLAIGDYNDTGRQSVMVTTFANEPKTLYRNDGGYFTDVTGTIGLGPPTLPFLAFGTGFLDTRNLGRLDLFIANGHVSMYSYQDNPVWTYKERNQLMLNDGAGRFAEDLHALPVDDVRVHRGACFADFDNDGRMDILVTAENDRPTLLRNNSRAGNWLLLSLTNKWGCATPIGTRCMAVVNGKRLTRCVIGGGSYGGESDHRVHFGLAGAAKVDHLEIHWMSGNSQVLENVAANQILHIREKA